VISGDHVRVSAPFDRAAAAYDRVFEENPVTRTIRPIVWATLLAHFKPGDHVLDLSCGTGTDAVALASRGIRVTAIDASGGMVREAKSKIAMHDLAAFVEFHEMLMEDIATSFSERFDGAFSNFGGLNCVDDLRAVLDKISGCLKPGGMFVACLLNRYAFWEMLSFLLRANISSAFRRLRGDGLIANIEGNGVRVRYYSTRKASICMSGAFSVQEVYGLNIVSPSPNSGRFIARHPVMTRRLLAVDDIIRKTFPFNSLGDHFVVVGKRRPQ